MLSTYKVPCVTPETRRDRLVYFRVSEHELDRIREACDSTGARNVSELARAAVQAFISGREPASDRQLLAAVRSLGDVLEEINRNLAEIVAMTRPAVSSLVAAVECDGNSKQPSEQ